jgi:hypothetical protein
VNAAATPPATTDVVLAGCPIDLLERSRRHNESLMRFAFIADSDQERAELGGCSRSWTAPGPAWSA